MIEKKLEIIKYEVVDEYLNIELADMLSILEKVREKHKDALSIKFWDDVEFDEDEDEDEVCDDLKLRIVYLESDIEYASRLNEIEKVKKVKKEKKLANQRRGLVGRIKHADKQSVKAKSAIKIETDELIKNTALKMNLEEQLLAFDKKLEGYS
jgi:hypothetical protein